MSNHTPNPEAIKARQANMQQVWDGIKEKAKPEDDFQMAQALAFAMVDMVEYVNTIESTAIDDRKYMEQVIDTLKIRTQQNSDLMQAINDSMRAGGATRDVWFLDDNGSKCTIVRMQDGLILGTFGREMAEAITAKLNTIPKTTQE